jgi:hypothetical protein
MVPWFDGRVKTMFAAPVSPGAEPSPDVRAGFRAERSAEAQRESSRNHAQQVSHQPYPLDLIIRAHWSLAGTWTFTSPLRPLAESRALLRSVLESIIVKEYDYRPAAANSR